MTMMTMMHRELDVTETNLTETASVQQRERLKGLKYCMYC
jgi:hypothetical protein